ncbi:hypothetical protein B4064_3522 [Caldibacillus thermoamylovorans]|uniref:carbohydrate ABC transporter permease n=1 Tax=Caldibacillus thermoamylovorans TaxID=35841 RepID=UPI0005A4B596|nr:carbohydrate ABC transporter permease [Caldibacillus thermoamylovorans]KIO60472.1 hypothetical protein B4064_3522 [Caldibacillus thermoamylovorans]
MFTNSVGVDWKSKLWKLSVILIALIATVAILFPYVYILLSSFKPAGDVVSTSPTIWPKEFSLENYIDMWESMPIGKYLANSLVAAVFSTIICVVLGSMASYAISRTIGSKLSYLFLVLVLCLKMLPLTSVAVPVYKIVQNLGLYDMKVTLVVVYAAINMPFVLWMMVSFFSSIPADLDEAAFMDGATPFQTFRKIILPVCAPGIVSTGIFTLLLAWNDFLFALLLTSSNAKTVPVAISEFLTSYNLDLGPMTSAAVLFSLPVIIISFFVQRYFVSGMMAGSVKE